MENTDGKSILIIEKDDPLRETLGDLLAMENYNIYNAKNGYSGFSLAKEKKPDLVICSRGFADSDCWSVLQGLREEEPTRETPFIFLSSRPLSELHQRMEDQEAVIVMTKPFSAKQLLDAVRECLSPQHG